MNLMSLQEWEGHRYISLSLLFRTWIIIYLITATLVKKEVQSIYLIALSIIFLIIINLLTVLHNLKGAGHLLNLAKLEQFQILIFTTASHQTVLAFLYKWVI